MKTSLAGQPRTLMNIHPPDNPFYLALKATITKQESIDWEDNGTILSDLFYGKVWVHLILAGLNELLVLYYVLNKPWCSIFIQRLSCL